MLRKNSSSEQSFLNSAAYAIQKSIINRETNSLVYVDHKRSEKNGFYYAPPRLAEPRRVYQYDPAVFKKSDEEKSKLANLKHQWRKEIQAQGYTKRKVPVGVNGTVITEKRIESL